MIFKEFHIDGFGKFNDFSIKELQHGVNIVSGDNEAGKSTLLKFIRYTLFGYPRRKKKRMKPINGGEHGGRIVVENKTDEIIFERFSGANGGDRNLSLNDSEVENIDSKWNELLSGADENLYKNVYSFSLEELVNFETLSESGVEDKIFSIGLGLGDKSISSIKNNIINEVEEIYNPRGSTQEVYQLQDKLEEQKQKVEDIKSNLNEYKDLIQKKENIKDEIKNSEEEIKELRAEKNKIKGALDSYDSFVEVKNVQEELENLPEQKDISASIEKIDQLQENKEKIEQEKKELKEGRGRKPGIEQLEEELESIDINQDILDRAEQIEFIRKNLEKYKQTLQDKQSAEQKITEINQRIDIKLNQLDSQWDEQDVKEFSDIIQHQDKIKDFKQGLGRIQQKRQELQSELKARRNQSSNSVDYLILLVGFICLIIAGSSFYYSAFTRAVAFMAGSLISFGFYLLSGKNEKDEIENQIEQLNQQEQQVTHNYKEYLKRLNLDQSLTPDGVLDIFSTVTNLKSRIKEKEQIEKKQKNQRQPYIDTFESEINEFREIIDLASDSSDYSHLAEEIISNYNENKDEQQQKEKLQEKLAQKRSQLEAKKEELAEINQEIQELINQAEATNLQEVKKVIDNNKNIEELTSKKKRAKETIEQIVGFKQADDVIQFLEGKDKQQLQAKITELEEDISQLEDQVEQKNSQLGETNQQVDQIAGESELSEEMTKLEGIKKQLSDARDEWLSGKLALTILSEVKEKYEREKQPAVIKRSSKYFRKITNGRYDRINVSLDEQKVSVYDSKQAEKSINQLSRGTKEQLLLTLRLGFIEEYETEAESLPVVMDEVFVNFDPERASKTAEVIKDFSSNRQVLIFTCRPETIKLFPSEINLISI